jgi:hypothetical protein
LDSKEHPAFPIVLLRRRRFGVLFPDFWKERLRKVVVFIQCPREMADEIPYGNRGLPNALPHEGSQPETPCMVAHPAGLKRCFLAIVSKDQHSLALSVAKHLLCEHVNIGHGDRPNGPRRLSKRASERTARGTAG